jgi:hypothetical protein
MIIIPLSLILSYLENNFYTQPAYSRNILPEYNHY